MIQLSPQDLPAEIAQELQRYQVEIDAVQTYAERVQRGKTLFSARNKATSRVFKTVRETLAAMCSGSCRCMYCEDSCADEVEHIRPKDLYPEFVFVWENYLYVCGPCNGGKNNAFAVFSQQTGSVIVVTRKQSDPVVSPTAGDDVLINPRIEDPLRYLALDLRNTFEFQPLPGLTDRDRERAIFTRDTLALNRDILVVARRHAYESYRARLREYIVERECDTPTLQLSLLVESLQRLQHPTVWREMQRQQQVLADLRSLFEQAPEALNW
ncbi:MAG: hypothetical protein DYG89_34120 [Caldilinea sp. CFX5]|nr:hypothetical protein [Caldilinea sp. CFX5]